MTPEAEALAAEHLPQAMRHARKWASKTTVDVDEAESAALVALVELANSFNPDAGPSFGTYLRLQLPFRLVDDLRATGLYERRRRDRGHHHDISFRSIDAYQEWSNAVGERHGTVEGAVSVDGVFDESERAVWLGQVRGLLDRVLAELSPAERNALIPVESGVKGMALAMATAEGVTEGRYSQRKRQAIERLRRQLALEHVAWDDVA